MHVCRAGTRHGQPSGPGNDLLVLLVGELTEAAAPLDSQRILPNEAVDGAGQESHAAPAGDDVPLRDEAVVTPAGDRFGGDGEATGEVLDREHLVARGHVSGRKNGLGLGGRGQVGGTSGIVAVQPRLRAALFVAEAAAFMEQTDKVTSSIGTHEFPPAGSPASVVSKT